MHGNIKVHMILFDMFGLYVFARTCKKTEKEHKICVKEERTMLLKGKKDSKDDKWKTSGKEIVQFLELKNDVRRSGNACLEYTRMCKVVK